MDLCSVRKSNCHSSTAPHASLILDPFGPVLESTELDDQHNLCAVFQGLYGFRVVE